MVRDGDVAWVGAATRVAKNIGVAARADVQAIVDKANADTAVAAQPGDRHAERSTSGATRTAARVGDGQHGRRRDAREVPGRCDAAITNSGGLRQDILVHRRRPRASSPARSRGARCSPCCRSATATVIETLTGAQLHQAMLNGVQPGVQPGRSRPGASRRCRAQGRLPLQRPDAGRSRGSRRRRTGRRGRSRRSVRPTPSASSPTTSCSPVATATRCSPRGTDVLQPGDALLDVTIDYIAANSPVAPVVEGRIVRH